MKFLVFIFISALFLVGCSKENPVEPPNNNSFAIYFLKDTTLTIGDILNTDLEDLELADKPWLTQYDIEFYDWSSHCIYLKKDKSYFFPNYKTIYQIPSYWKDRPWIVVGDHIASYKGYFVTETSTNIYPFPEMNLMNVSYYPSDIISSNWIYWFFNADIRNNERVKNALKKLGLFRAGLNVTIDSHNFPIKIFNNDTTTVEYTLIFKNNNEENTYVFDPNKVESEIYNFFNNGPNLINLESMQSYGSIYKKSKKPDSWPNSFRKEWYTLLKSGESITRIIKLKAYSNIPNGMYAVQINYSTPKYGLEKNIREDGIGCYWIGSILSDTIHFSLKN